jgi:hypothetical protein
MQDRVSAWACWHCWLDTYRVILLLGQVAAGRRHQQHAGQGERVGMLALLVRYIPGDFVTGTSS